MILYVFDYLFAWMKLSTAPPGGGIIRLRLKVFKAFIDVSNWTCCITLHSLKKKFDTWFPIISHCGFSQEGDGLVIFTVSQLTRHFKYNCNFLALTNFFYLVGVPTLVLLRGLLFAGKKWWLRPNVFGSKTSSLTSKVSHRVVFGLFLQPVWHNLIKKYCLPDTNQMRNWNNATYQLYFAW